MRKKKTFTHGPWVVHDSYFGGRKAVMVGPDGDGDDDGAACLVAYGEVFPRLPYTLNDARLISAAPEMLVWIRDVLKSPDRFSDAELDAAERISLKIGEEVVDGMKW